MNRYTIKTVVFVVCILLSSIGQADSKRQVLHAAFQEIDDSAEKINLIGYQSLEYSEPDQVGVKKYIILDFRPSGMKLVENEEVTHVDKICRQIVRNNHLLHNLVSLGYEMVSVAFDDTSQYDCL